VVVEVTGGNVVPHANLAVSFTGAMGLNHFGADPVRGVVTGSR
jgi:hypothetical protein